MPLNDHEQKILEEIERRLSEEDPRLVEQVSRTNLHTHAWTRMKMALVGFLVGIALLFFVGLNVWVAAAGFVLMTLSALLAYRYAGRLGDDSVAPGAFGRIAARVAGRIRRPTSGLPPEE
jgi:hypothetical protein